MNSYSAIYMLKHLPKDYPIDLINLISEFVCDCGRVKCDFCNDYFSSCYLKRCASCKMKSCGSNPECLNYPVDYLLTYSGLHKELKCCHKCQICQSN